MPTADESVYALVNGQLLGSRRCKLLDYSDLFNSPPRRGRNRPKPLLNEVRFNPRRGNEKVAQLAIQIQGRWTEDNAPEPGDAAEEAHAFALALGAEEEDGGLLGVGLETVTFEFHYFTQSFTCDCQALGVFGITWPAPAIANAVVELSLPPVLGLLAS